MVPWFGRRRSDFDRITIDLATHPQHLSHSHTLQSILLQSNPKKLPFLAKPDTTTSLTTMASSLSQTWSRTSAKTSSAHGSSDVQHITHGLGNVSLQTSRPASSARSVSSSSTSSVTSTSSKSSTVSRSCSKAPWIRGSNPDYTEDDVVPGHRKPYVPRYAARSFLSTTSVMAEVKR
nr:hypothetical protein CFP56_28797 [Quercus suber]